MKTFDGTPIATVINNETGIAFNMRLVRKGDGYGRDLALIHDNDRPLVEFYDSRYVFEGERGAEFGQFVSRYYVDTFTRGNANSIHGLALDGGVPAWCLSSGAVHTACVILANWTGIIGGAKTR